MTVKTRNLQTYQCQAAGDDHDDDECLEVVVLDDLEGVAAQLPPLLAQRRVRDRLEARAALDAALRTAVVRVAHEEYLHLPEQQTQAAGLARAALDVALRAAVVRVAHEEHLNLPEQQDTSSGVSTSSA